MATLDDLPPYRRAKLLWDNAHFGVWGVDQMVREAAGTPCRLTSAPVPDSPRMAVLGDDGRYHLMSGDQMHCSKKLLVEQGWEHRQDCSWWSTSAGAVQAGDYEQYRCLDQRWFVNLVGEEGVPLDSVPAGLRCQGHGYGGPYESFHYWPPPPARTREVRRLRTALVEALGADCHLCHALPGAMVDHDYATGLVRGLLCRFCNRVVEECPHVDGCPKADYMDSPPAAHLELPYPSYLAWTPKASTRATKVNLLGFDPLAEWRSLR
ncbi:endonuclease VII domain-containing protein [Streptomyces sp. NBC_00820]|uniref:endonuclease domain-containing protein n=1 Tax=Streptomyces sp. NBC_00820 TaxID=2975842 RepID=UPI002ED1625B|nr:endonuclease VII domain-containing protein [Streptomyces sp. NBC_00820]